MEILKLHRLMAFIRQTGNGDRRLKNFSVLVGEDGFVRLTPGDRLVCTRLVIPNAPSPFRAPARRAGLIERAGCNSPPPPNEVFSNLSFLRRVSDP